MYKTKLGDIAKLNKKAGHSTEIVRDREQGTTEGKRDTQKNNRENRQLGKMKTEPIEILNKLKSVSKLN